MEISDLYVPQYVLRGRDVRLACQYRTVGTRVYAVKWFKNKNEFYRYVPQYDPPKKTFKVAGFTVDVSIGCTCRCMAGISCPAIACIVLYCIVLQSWTDPQVAWRLQSRVRAR